MKKVIKISLIHNPFVRRTPFHQPHSAPVTSLVLSFDSSWCYWATKVIQPKLLNKVISSDVAKSNQQWNDVGWSKDGDRGDQRESWQRRASWRQFSAGILSSCLQLVVSQSFFRASRNQNCQRSSAFENCFWKSLLLKNQVLQWRDLTTLLCEETNYSFFSARTIIIISTNKQA